MYCFEFDQTICDCGERLNIFSRLFRTFRSSICVNPADFDIRWTITTNRPYIDRNIIKLYCILNGLAPCDVITYNKITYPKTKELGYQFKIDYFRSVLDGKIKVKYTDMPVENIIHVCNNKDENKYINMNNMKYPILSINSLDFKTSYFNRIM